MAFLVQKELLDGFPGVKSVFFARVRIPVGDGLQLNRKQS